MKLLFFFVAWAAACPAQIFGHENKAIDDARRLRGGGGDALSKEHCVVNVHGFHHTGTGVLRAQVWEALLDAGGQTVIASQHEHTGVPESEGQHLQTVYPASRDRLKNPQKWCGSPKGDEFLLHVAQTYYCPKLVTDLAVNPGKKQKLFDELARYWDMKKQVLIQKTPVFDVLFLEHAKVHPTVHTLVMRHPFNWHNSYMDRYISSKKEKAPNNAAKAKTLMKPFVWLAVWTHVLELFATGQIESFAVVHFEAMVLHPEETQKELLTVVDDTCHLPKEKVGDEDEDKQRQRRLELHKSNKDYLKPKEGDAKLWSQCQRDQLCTDLMNDMEPILKALGYKAWDQDDYYYDKKNIVFSSMGEKPIMKLVQQMKDLVEKYK